MGQPARLLPEESCDYRSNFYHVCLGGYHNLLQWTSERFELHSRPEMRVLLPKRRGRIASFAPERPAMECLVAASTVRVHGEISPL